MRYHIDDAAMDLETMAERLESCDPIPSHLPLLAGLREKTVALAAAGVTSLAALRRELKKPAPLSALATRAGIDEGYLILLRRAVEGWFPKPPHLAEFPRTNPAVTAALGRAGIADARVLLEAAAGATARRALAESAGVQVAAVDELARLADLTRLQWVSPLFARMLHDAGFRSVAEVAAADGEAIYDAVRALNADGSYYRGAIGKRDMDRLVLIARHTPVGLEAV
jgi:predicted flap endonuclease-1-like 5' DNA nuclease